MKKIIVFILTLTTISVTVLSQSSCECTAVKLSTLLKFRNLDDSEREDYLLENCYQPSQDVTTKDGASGKKFTKCHLRNMIDGDDNEFKEGDYTIGLWDDNSVSFKTRKVANYTAIKKKLPPWEDMMAIRTGSIFIIGVS